MVLDLKKKKILVIDDYANMRTALRNMVEAIGAVHVDTSSSGEDAVSKLTETSYDIVLCDYNLGSGKNGQQVLEEAKLRKLIGYSTVFIMITADNSSDIVMSAVEYFPDAYLTKPINKEVLRTRFGALMDKKNSLAPVDKLLAHGMYDRALIMCNHLIAQRPRYVSDVQKLKAEIALQAGDLDVAEEVYESVLERRPLPWALMGRARVQFEREQYRNALETLEMVVQENSSYMAAYDLMARAHLALQESESAQQVLEEAITISPVSILRQRTLGDIAISNGDYQAAEKACRRSVSLGKHSIYKEPAGYSKLAKVLVKNGSGKEAVRVMKEMRGEYRGDQQVTLQAAVTEGVVYSQLNMGAESQKAYQQSKKLIEELGVPADQDVAMDMMDNAIHFDDRELALNLVEQLVQSHHDNPQLLEQVQQKFDETDYAEEIKGVVASATAAMVKLNNEGVALFRNGKLDESVRFFDEVAASMPQNCTVNLNAARVHMEYAKHHSMEAQSLEQAAIYLERVAAIDANNKTYKKQRQEYRKLQRQVEQNGG